MKLPESHPLWIVFRIAVILFFAMPPLQGAWENENFQTLHMPANFAILFMAFLLLRGFWQMRWVLKRMIKGKEERNENSLFYRPSWSLNPFLKNEAYQFMHMGCLAFLISGITGFARYFLFSSMSNSFEWIMPAFLVVVSCTWLIGMYINLNPA
jgi:hypothetical protein